MGRRATPPQPAPIPHPALLLPVPPKPSHGLVFRALPHTGSTLARVQAPETSSHAR